ncbi:MAG: proton-conducting transporter membrane subunit, partial [Saprospiraceae bacterium]
MNALLILFTTALLALFAGLTHRRSMLQPIAMVGAIAALLVTLLEMNQGSTSGWNFHYASMFQFDVYAQAFTAVVLVSTILILGLSSWGFRGLNDTLGDNYALILFSLCGALCLASFTNLVMLFLGIEILSIPLYVLAGSRRDDLASNEAALKYFLMGAFATGFLLFGIALVYGATATFDLQGISSAVSDGRHSAGMLHMGILLILVGLGFKISA